MNVGDLEIFASSCSMPKEQSDKLELRVAAMGGMRSSKDIAEAMLGFDWDNGAIVLHPRSPLQLMPADDRDVEKLWQKVWARSVGASMHSRHDGVRGHFVTVDVPTRKGSSTLKTHTFQGEYDWIKPLQDALLWIEQQKAKPKRKTK